MVSFLTGMVGVLVALPAGWLADLTRRDYLLKACGATSLGDLPSKSFTILQHAASMLHLPLC